MERVVRMLEADPERGLSPEEVAASDASVRIPMQGAAESLNVAVATGIILFEAARQRAPN